MMTLNFKRFASLFTKTDRECSMTSADVAMGLKVAFGGLSYLYIISEQVFNHYK